MCFSPEMDAVAGLAVSAIGVDALRHVRHRRELPMAILPLVFGVHQLIEAVIWLGCEGRVSETVWRPALWVYLTIAFGVIPILVPVAVGNMEPNGSRAVMRGLTLLGAIVAAFLMAGVIRGPLDAQIDGHHLAYGTGVTFGGLLFLLYIVATCGPMLVSRYRNLRLFGQANLVAALLLSWLNQAGAISLWCGWAAVTSVAIAVHLRSRDEPVLSQPLPA